MSSSKMCANHWLILTIGFNVIRHGSMILIWFGYMTDKYLRLSLAKCSVKVIVISAGKAIERAYSVGLFCKESYKDLWPDWKRTGDVGGTMCKLGAWNTQRNLMFSFLKNTHVVIFLTVGNSTSLPTYGNYNFHISCCLALENYCVSKTIRNALTYSVWRFFTLTGSLFVEQLQFKKWGH